MIACGWCGHPTADEDRCESCRHPNPRLPWDQRGEAVPVIREGRPALDRGEVRRRLAEARAAGATTVEQIAEHLEVSPRTVRRWRELS